MRQNRNGQPVARHRIHGEPWFPLHRAEPPEVDVADILASAEGQTGQWRNSYCTW
jgi:hypothetical protein